MSFFSSNAGTGVLLCPNGARGFVYVNLELAEVLHALVAVLAGTEKP